MKIRSLSISLLLALAGAVLSGCSRGSAEGMYPDYSGVTVPCNIAPLNFYYIGVRGAVTTFECGDQKVTVRGRDVRIPQAKWEKLLESAKGGTISVSSTALPEWSIQVSEEPIDRYLTYRLIEPGYEVWDRVEICERDLSNFSERAICSWKNTGNACMNCHVHKGSRSLFYIRGKNGGAILNDGKDLRKLSLKSDGMISSTVYGDLAPDGRWGVFSTNIIIPGFHTGAVDRLEVFDTASDLAIADFQNNRMLSPGIVARNDRLETFPCFNADGSAIFFCSADSVAIPGGIKTLQYSLMMSSFDSQTGEVGTPVTVWDGPAHGKSVCHPKASPDGRWVMFTVADYGTFPIWHRECDLMLLDTASGKTLEMTEANSNRSDTYHSWSSNSRWFVFASKRGDGQFGKPYFCHIDEYGNCSRPFVLPQEDPHHYDNTLKSYNIPDLGEFPVPFDSERISEIGNNAPAEKFN